MSLPTPTVLYLKPIGTNQVSIESSTVRYFISERVRNCSLSPDGIKERRPPRILIMPNVICVICMALMHVQPAMAMVTLFVNGTNQVSIESTTVVHGLKFQSILHAVKN